MWKCIIYICDHLQILFSDIANPPNEEDIFMFPSRKSCFCDKYFKKTTFNFMNVKMTNKIKLIISIPSISLFDCNASSTHYIRKCLSVMKLLYNASCKTHLSVMIHRWENVLYVKKYDIIRMWFTHSNDDISIFNSLHTFFLLHTFCASLIITVSS